MIGNNAFSQSLALTKSQLDNAYTRYKEQALQSRRFKHSEVVKLLEDHRLAGTLKIEPIGESVQKRSIYEVQYGMGNKVVMLWSQMHGDEPTATMALFDVFNFLTGKADGFDDIRQVLKQQLDLRFIPMLNPDGAEVYTRRNAQQIDLNRDARDTATPEGKLLRSRAETLHPQYGFNLHDQHIYYNVPGTRNPVTISLLAPAYNANRDVNDVRGNAMKIIVGMEELLQQYIPGAIAKYDDEHSPRAFGDNFQKWGASTVLIESGAFKGDPEKQEIRKLNFVMIVHALLQIAQGTYVRYDLKDYERIPFNANQLHDIVLRNVSAVAAGLPLQADVAIRRDEITVGRDYYVKGYVEDIGDLKEFYGYEELDAEGYTLAFGKLYPEQFLHPDQLTKEKIKELLKSGYSTVLMKEQSDLSTLKLPIRSIHEMGQFRTYSQLRLGQEATFFLKKGDSFEYAIINGYLLDLSK